MVGPDTQYQERGLSIETQQKLQSLADHDLNEYNRLKSLEERYKKADENLGKIVAIFLTDLGIRVSQNTRTALSEPMKNATTDAQPAARPVDQDLQTKPVSGSKIDSKPPATNTPPPAPNFAAEKRIDELRESDVEEFLAKTRIDDLYSSLREVNGVSGDNQALLNMIGKFAGTAMVSDDGKSKAWETSIDLSLTKREPKPEGHYRIVLSENGKPFSNTSGEGKIGGDFREFTNGSKALLMRASPSIFLQVYYAKGLDSLIGNVYRTNESQQYQLIGTLQMRRSPH